MKVKRFPQPYTPMELKYLVITTRPTSVAGSCVARSSDAASRAGLVQGVQGTEYTIGVTG